ncbi:Zinc finger matrin-type protein 2 [Tritrichomonas foetus]|uniref:Zinc finger matrin-type protein 2 n=1 Tax=Tritrichomonas foetus TaxID=1144522 RepID=A0A1J4KFF9_9EUKA|nr:Zinc finger matrin-type protein 2 [Tritrichomonas foetus]|eukprot:OHT09762.1 Zinc finger matrin-type protein 2 [Tritrichomonas foetus]
MTKRDEYGRYEWDEEHFNKRFEERMKSEKEKREAKKAMESISTKPLNNLVSRTDFVDLSHGINKRRVIGENVPIDKIGHFSCPVCQLFFRDSSIYLKHLNSPEHNQKMGMSMKVVPTTDEQVLLRLKQWEDFYTRGIEVPPMYKEYKEVGYVDDNNEMKDQNDQ